MDWRFLAEWKSHKERNYEQVFHFAELIMGLSGAPKNMLDNIIMEGLYNKSDPVYILDDSDFTVNPMGEATLNRDAFRGSGIIKAYAPWCPHCRDKVEDIKTLGRVLKENPSYGVSIYVLNADNAPNMSRAKEGSDALIAGFPTLLFVDPDRNVSKLTDEGGESVYSVPDAITALCKSHKKLCDYNPQRKQRQQRQQRQQRA